MIKTCPFCKEGHATFSLWWWLDVDTYLRCNQCGARLAHINFLATAVLYAVAIVLLFWVFQRNGIEHGMAATKRKVQLMAVLFFVLIAGIRLGLVWLLWIVKTPNRLIPHPHH